MCGGSYNRDPVPQQYGGVSFVWVKKKLDEISVYPIMPILCNFPFVGMTPYLDIHALFGVQAMHLFHIGESRTTKEAATDLPRCTELRITTGRWTAG